MLKPTMPPMIPVTTGLQTIDQVGRKLRNSSERPTPTTPPITLKRICHFMK